MKSHKEKSLNVFGLFCFGAVLLLILTVSYVQAGAPRIEETCIDSNRREIQTRYDSNLQVFAEARLLPEKEAKNAIQRNKSPYVIYINPERYYLGKYTQIWLYHRQCAHIRKQHMVAKEGNKQLNIDEETLVDCLAIETMRELHNISKQQIKSIQRDIERLIPKNRWSEVLEGPQRRISLTSCPHQ